MCEQLVRIWLDVEDSLKTQGGSVKKFVSLEENDSFLVRITI